LTHLVGPAKLRTIPKEVAMSTTASSAQLQLGQLVRRRTEPSDGRVGFVAGVVFVAPTLALVRWPGAGSSFEPEDSLVEVYRLH
jgi:hypothetical protein